MMADIDRIAPNNPIIPPVPQDRVVEEPEKKKQRDGNEGQSADDENENNRDNDRDGIDYYA